MYTLPYMTRSMGIAEARQDLARLIDEVCETHERVVLTRHGNPVAVVLSLDDLESIEETLEILSDTDLVTDIRGALASSERFTMDQVRSALRDRDRH